MNSQCSFLIVVGLPPEGPATGSGLRPSMSRKDVEEAGSGCGARPEGKSGGDVRTRPPWTAAPSAVSAAAAGVAGTPSPFASNRNQIEYTSYRSGSEISPDHRPWHYPTARPFVNMIEGLGSDGVSTDRAYLHRVAAIAGTRLLWQRLMATPPNTLPAPGWRPSPLRRCELPVVLAVARSGRAKCVGAAPSLSTGQPRIARKRAQWLARWKGVLPLPSASHSPAQTKSPC